MSWSLKIGTLFRIPVRLHISMLLIPFLIFDFEDLINPLALIIAAAATAMVFGFVLAHELGHALVARRFGIHTQDIILTPLGGMARVVNMPQNPKQEIAIAAAGPAVSLVLAAIFTALYFLFPGFVFVVGGKLFEPLAILAFVNGMLGVFNMIPALPMDGGRILRGLLALKYDFVTATRKAARVGKVLAIVGVVIGAAGFFLPAEQRLFSPWTIILISAFVFLSAGMEQKVAEWRESRSRAAQGFAGAPGGAAPGSGPRVYTWTARPRARNSGRSAPRQQPTQRPGQRPRPADENGEPIVIEGGKAEVLSRKDPTD